MPAYAETPAPAPAPAKKARKPPRGPLVGGLVALAVGVPLGAVSTAGLCVGSALMGIVLLRVQDWDTGEFKLEEDPPSADLVTVTDQRAWKWSRNAFPFFVVGAGLGAIATAIGTTLLLSSVLVGGRE